MLALLLPLILAPTAAVRSRTVAEDPGGPPPLRWLSAGPPSQCEPTLLQWEGGTPPYRVRVLGFNYARDIGDGIEGTGMEWLCDFEELTGVAFGVAGADAGDEDWVWTEVRDVEAGSDGCALFKRPIYHDAEPASAPSHSPSSPSTTSYQPQGTATTSPSPYTHSNPIASTSSTLPPAAKPVVAAADPAEPPLEWAPLPSLWQCEPAVLAFSGGEPPYRLYASLDPPGAYDALPCSRGLGFTNATSFTWTVDYAAGSVVRLTLADYRSGSEQHVWAGIRDGSDSCELYAPTSLSSQATSQSGTSATTARTSRSTNLPSHITTSSKPTTSEAVNTAALAAGTMPADSDGLAPGLIGAIVASVAALLLVLLGGWLVLRRRRARPAPRRPPPLDLSPRALHSPHVSQISQSAPRLSLAPSSPRLSFSPRRFRLASPTFLRHSPTQSLSLPLHSTSSSSAGLPSVQLSTDSLPLQPQVACTPVTPFRAATLGSLSESSGSEVLAAEPKRGVLVPTPYLAHRRQAPSLDEDADSVFATAASEPAGTPPPYELACLTR